MSRIVIAGRIGRHQQDRIISTEGICPALTAGSHLNAEWMNLILDVKDSDEHDGGRDMPDDPRDLPQDRDIQRVRA